MKRRRGETTWILASGSGVAPTAAAAATAARWLSGSLSELIWRLSFIASLLLCLTGRCRGGGAKMVAWAQSWRRSSVEAGHGAVDPLAVQEGGGGGVDGR